MASPQPQTNNSTRKTYTRLEISADTSSEHDFESPSPQPSELSRHPTSSNIENDGNRDDGHIIGEYLDNNSSSSSLELTAITSSSSSEQCAYADKGTIFEEYFPRRFRYAASKIRHFLTTNLIEDQVVLDLYRRICRFNQVRVIDGQENCIDGDGGLVLIKIVKLWIVTIVGILIIHPLARVVVRFS